MPSSNKRDPGRQVRRLLLRAVALYMSLVAADGAIILWVLLHDFNQRVERTKILEAHELGQDLAERIGAELAPEGAIDQLRVIKRGRLVSQVIEEYVSRVPTVNVVELRSPEGGVVLQYRRGQRDLRPSGLSFGGVAPNNPDSPPAGRLGVAEPGSLAGRTSAEGEIQVPLAGGAGLLLLGVTPDAIRAESDELWRAWMFRLVVGGLLSVLLLAVAFLYVLRLIHRTRRLEAEAQQAEQLAQLGTLASGLAHEIRNPLNAMNINLQLLEEELPGSGLGEESVSMLRSSRAEVQRLERLVKDFLAFARPPRSSPEMLAPAELVADVVRFSTPEFHSAGVSLEFEQQEGAPEVRVDAAQIRQALLNVLQNALEASEPGGRVVVRVGASSLGEASIEIDDEGPGIPEDTRAHIFDVFWSRKPAGSGLGLPIARRAVENHGGRIEVARSGSGGSVFRILLPSAVAGGPDLEEIEEPVARADRAPRRLP